MSDYDWQPGRPTEPGDWWLRRIRDGKTSDRIAHIVSFYPGEPDHAFQGPGASSSLLLDDVTAHARIPTPDEAEALEKRMAEAERRLADVKAVVAGVTCDDTKGWCPGCLASAVRRNLRGEP